MKVLLDERAALEHYINALLLEGIGADLPQAVQTPPAPEIAPPATVAPCTSTALVPYAAPEPNVPSWAQCEFQALLFEVGGLTLAIRLVELNGIDAWDDSITPMPGHAPWFLGVLTRRGRYVKVIDPYHMVVPKHRRDAARAARPSRIVLIGGGDWGLACDKIARVVRLGAENVRWRRVRNQRPWLLGMVKEHVCALVDAAEFADALERGQ